MLEVEDPFDFGKSEHDFMTPRSTMPIRRCWPLIVMLAGPGCGTAESAAPASPLSPAPRPSAPVQATPVTVPNPDVVATVDSVLSTASHPLLQWGHIADVAPALKSVYDAEPDRLFWFDDARPVARLEDTVAALAHADEHGLAPSDYDAATLAQLWTPLKAGTGSAADRALFDLAVSTAVARLVKAVSIGRVDPATMYWGYGIASKQIDVPSLMRAVRDGAGLAATLDALSPVRSHYQRARRVLAVFRAHAAGGEPPLVPALPRGQSKILPGKPWDGIPSVAARLRAFGDLQVDADAGSPVYSSAIVDAVKRFQWRHGLERDGTIGAGTIRALNVTIAQRIRQIELAMERMRWLPKLDDQANVFVNLPLFRLWATDPASGQEPLRMNVVVGKSLDHQTPIFIEKMQYVIFRPYWNPPQSILAKEIVPHARRDPAYFAKEDLEIVATGDEDAAVLPPTPDNLSQVIAGRLHVRQRPGPKNSLGLAKFIFPNDENVYMHGTPASQLFARARRDFSHGCIRLEDPARFAEWVLRDQPDWTRARIDAAMQGERPTRVNLKQPLTVVLFYDTVHVNSDGVVFFVDDIYGHDRALDTALTRGYPYPVKN